MSRHQHKSSGFGSNTNKRVKQDYGHKDSRDLESSSQSQSSQSSSRNKQSEMKKQHKRHSSDSRSNSSSSRQQRNKKHKGQKTQNRHSSSESRSSSQKERQYSRPPQNRENEIIVKGLNYSASESEIGEFFGQCGPIESMNILKNQDGTSKGIAFIRFKTEDGFVNGLKQDGVKFMDFSLKIEKTRPREQRDNKFRPNAPRGDSLTIFVGNLSFLVNEHSLKQLFRGCGHISEVRIAKNPEGKSRGFGYVEFGDQQAVSKALAKNGDNLDGRPIRVDVANSKPKADRAGGYQQRTDRDNRRPYDGSKERRGSGRQYGNSDWK